MAVVAVLVAGLALSRVAEVSDDLTTMKAHNVDSLQQIAEIRGGIADMYRGMLLYQIGTDDAGRRQGRDAVTASDTRVDAAVAAYRTIAAESPSRQQSLDAFTDAMNRYRSLRNTVVFREPAPAGFTLPPESQLSSASSSEPRTR